MKIMQDTTYAKVDVGTPFSGKTKRRLSLDKAVMVGGASRQINARTIASRNYQGCVSYIILSGLDILQRLSKQNTGLRWGCKDDVKFDAISYDSKEAFVSFINPVAPSLDIGLQFRTYYQDGVLITNEISNRSTIKHDSENTMGFTLYFEKNVVNLRVQDSIVASIRPSENIDFGSWHVVRLRMSGKLVRLTLGKQTKVVEIKSRQSRVSYKDEVFIGKGTHVAQTFRGWIWNITMNDRRLSYLNATGRNAVAIYIYRMTDYCYPNQCENGGRCIQTYDGPRCNCSKTGFDGETCSKRIKVYKKTCYDYYVSGIRTNGIYVIEPGSKPMKVYCKMDDEDGPKTILRTKQGSQLKAVYEALSSDNDFYYHHFDYFADREQVDNLVKISGYCRQYIEFYCSSSTLMFSNDEENALANRYGARWFSSDGRIKHYWGGGNKKPFTCACGLKGNCADPQLKCNCDVMDKQWRSDGGYLDDKNDLPVSRIQFSRKYTNPSAMFKLGPLECFDGDIKTTTTTTRATTTATTTTTVPTPTKKSWMISSSVPSISTKIIQGYDLNSLTLTSKFIKTESTKTEMRDTTTDRPWTELPRTTKEMTGSSTSMKNNQTDSPRSEMPTTTGVHTTVLKQEIESPSADVTTKTGPLLRSTISSLLSNGYARHTSPAINDKQMVILVALIASLALLTLILIAAVLRYRFFKSSKKLTVELKKDPESGSAYSDSESVSSSDKPLAADDKQYRSMSDINSIEIIRVASPYGKPTASDSVSSVSSFDTSRYLEVGDESENGSSSSFTKRKGILKSNNKFIVSTRPKSEGDIDDPEEVIGLIHINTINATSKSAENTSLLSKTSEHLEDVKFHLHPRDANRKDKMISYSERDSYSDKESIDAETGFITDSSSSFDSRKSLSSSGGEESNDEFYSKKIRRPKRSVRFSIQELSPKKEAKIIRGISDSRYRNEVDDEVFT